MNSHAKKNLGRTGRSLLLAMLGLTAGALVLAGPGNADELEATGQRCKSVRGGFHVQALPDDQCSSPAGRCTAGHLTGALHGEYGMVLQTLTPSPVPDIHFYQGINQIQRPHGVAFTGIETGSIDFSRDRFGHFVSLITITEITGEVTGKATGPVAGATGQIMLRGELDFLGGGDGKYEGQICWPE